MRPCHAARANAASFNPTFAPRGLALRHRFARHTPRKRLLVSFFKDSIPGDGGLLRHEAVEAPRDVIIYRLWDSTSGPANKKAKKLGGYWTDFAASSEASARKTLAVCPGWNNMKQWVRCTLPKGTVVVKGPGQSVDCSRFRDAASSARYPGGPQQIFVPEPTKLTNCKVSETGW